MARLAEYQFLPDEAATFAAGRRWQSLTLKERAVLQLSQRYLCMDLEVFREAIDELLGRSVLLHELGDLDALWREYRSGERLSVDEILAKLPPNSVVFHPKD